MQDFVARNGADRALALIDRVVRPLAMYVGGVMVIGLAVLTVVAVIFRYGFNSPIFGVADIAQLLLLGAVTVSVAHSGRTGGQVAVEVLTNLMGPRVCRWTDFFVKIIGCAMMVFLSIHLFLNGFDAAAYGETSNSLVIPFGPYYQALACGMMLYALVLLVESYVHLRGRTLVHRTESLEDLT